MRKHMHNTAWILIWWKLSLKLKCIPFQKRYDILKFKYELGNVEIN